MYIDPQIKTFIDGLVELNMPHPVDLGIEGARDGFSQLWQQVNPPSRDSVKVEDIQVPGPSGDIR
ncbi:MAG: hypothetical protein HN420_04270, partial [Rhodospirillaceae bacterium]|nr:hypothetical protein [Rhodospirillaceae bacterium]